MLIYSINEYKKILLFFIYSIYEYKTRSLSGSRYINCYIFGGTTLKFLVNTGGNKRFINEKIAFNSKPVDESFIIHSAGGDIKIIHKVSGKFFASLGNNTTVDFFVLPGLKTFDGIIEDDTLRKLEAVIDRKNNTLYISHNIEIQLLTKKKSKQVQCLDSQENCYLENLLDKYSSLFGPVNEKTTIETSVKTEIKTTTDEAVHSKSYPTHLQEVDTEIKKLLENKTGLL